MSAESELFAAAKAAHIKSRLAALAEEIHHFTAAAQAATVPEERAEAAARLAVALQLVEALQPETVVS